MSSTSDPFLWNIRPTPASPPNQFANVTPRIATLLQHRGITTADEAAVFLHPDYERDRIDPAKFVDMAKAVDRIVAAIKKGEQIMIHGDYDADGVCGAAVLYLTLQHLGAVVDVYLPHRDTEGYGMNMATVQSFHDVGVKLIITVDCGISNAPEVAKAAALGMDIIVTDHHSEPPILPNDALAILNPKLQREQYPFRYLAGVGVAFKLCQALLQQGNSDKNFEKWLLDLVAISTMTDCVELLGENRLLVVYGLKVLQKNRRLGLAQLLTILNIDPTSVGTETIAFKIGPHVNAAGRMKHANAAFELFVTRDAGQAAELARDLVKTNIERQRMVQGMVVEAQTQARGQQDEPVIVVEGKNWPVGLVGLVAGKISGETGKPAFALTTMTNPPWRIGSGRSIEQFSLVDAMHTMPELFLKYGGHPMACGFSLKDATARDTFIVRMRARAREMLKNVDLRPTLIIDCELAFVEIDTAFVEAVALFAPFGQANPEPLFLTHNVHVASKKIMGKNGAHARLQLKESGVQLEAVAFGVNGRMQELQEGNTLSVVYMVRMDTWNGVRRLQLFVKDFGVQQS